MTIMIPESFRLYDTLNCAAIAIDEAESGCPAAAKTAWRNALAAADGIFAPVGDLNAALTMILAASAPSRSGEYRASLRNALNAASLAVLPAMEGDREITALCLPDAEEAAGFLSGDLRDALQAILGVIRSMAATGVAA